MIAWKKFYLIVIKIFYKITRTSFSVNGRSFTSILYISKWRCHPFTFFRRPFFGNVCVLLVLFVNKPLIKSSKNAKIKFHSSRENVASDKGYPHPHTASYFNDHICFSLVRKTNSFSTFYYNDKIIHGH